MSDFLANFVRDDRTGIDFIDNNRSALGSYSYGGGFSSGGSFNDQDGGSDGPEDDPRVQDPEESFYAKKDDCLRTIVKIRNMPDEELVIKPLKRSALTFLNKSVIFYGPSGSGKTFLIYFYMFLMQHLFPLVFIFAPTNDEKHDFDNIVPIPLIFTEFGLEDIKSIYQRQKAATQIYNMANNLKVLYSLFNRVAQPKARQIYRKILLLRLKILKRIPETYEAESVRKAKTQSVEELFKYKFIKFYKSVIAPHIRMLLTQNLTKEEKFAIRYINFNPRTLVVFDDSTVEILNLIKEGKKKIKGQINQSGEHIKNFFFKGRWANITHWYAFHDDARLETDIRKNAFYSFFCNRQVALSYFQRPANNFSPADKKRAEAAINMVFSDTAPSKHTKLVYAREEGKFYYVVAEDVGNFTMCSDQIRAYCEKIKTNDKLTDTNNPFMSRFTEKINF
jgi:hypothetical protein